jgi:hypothetical protein
MARCLGTVAELPGPGRAFEDHVMTEVTLVRREPKDIFRVASDPATANADLGLLQSLPGRWVGRGFNLIARPARQGNASNPVFFLELNGTRETLEFTAIGGDIPNRGDVEKTADLHAVHYLQTVADCADDSFIHKEPGLWVHVPPTAENQSDTYVRQAVIPHGDSLLAESSLFTTVSGGPDIQPVNSLPFPITDPIPPLNDVTHATVTNPQYLAPYLNPNSLFPTDCLPPGLDPAATVKDPTEVLRARIKGQTFKSTDVIVISTAVKEKDGTITGGVVNIPFVIKNANAVRMDAIFWIERVSRPQFDIRQGEFLQLQYVQRVILDFENLHWPHVSVATLVKAG